MTQIAAWSYETFFAAEPGSASKARDFIGEHLAAHGLMHLVDDVRLGTSELTTNAVVVRTGP